MKIELVQGEQKSISRLCYVKMKGEKKYERVLVGVIGEKVGSILDLFPIYFSSSKFFFRAQLFFGAFTKI